MRKNPFERSELLEAYSRVPAEEFIPCLINDLRSQCIYVQTYGDFLKLTIEDGKSINPEPLDRFISTVSNRMEYLSNILDAAINFDDIQTSKRNKQDGKLTSSVV